MNVGSLFTETCGLDLGLAGEARPMRAAQAGAASLAAGQVAAYQAAQQATRAPGRKGGFADGTAVCRPAILPRSPRHSEAAR